MKRFFVRPYKQYFRNSTQLFLKSNYSNEKRIEFKSTIESAQGERKLLGQNNLKISSPLSRIELPSSVTLTSIRQYSTVPPRSPEKMNGYMRMVGDYLISAEKDLKTSDVPWKRFLYFALAAALSNFILEGIKKIREISRSVIGRIPLEEKSIIDIAAPRKDNIERDALSRLEDFVRGKTNKQGITKILITGVEGSGKTEMALSYARAYKTRINTDGVIPSKKTFIFLSAKNTEEISRDYRNFANRLGLIAESMTNDELIKQVNQQLACRPGWLLIFDDVQEYSVVEKYIPTSTYYALPPEKSTGQVIITARKLELPNDVHKIDLNDEEYCFSKTEAIKLFNSFIGSDQTDSDMLITKGALLEKLRFLPLSIKRAALYIKKNPQPTIKEAIEDYQQKLIKEIGGDMANCAANQQHDLINKSVNKLSLEKLSPLALNILKLVIYVNSQHCERSLIESYIESVSVKEMNNALDELSDYGILNEVKVNTYQVHSSVKKAYIEIEKNKNSLSLSESDIMLEHLKINLGFLKKLFSADNRLESKQKNHRALIPHVNCLLRNYFDLINRPDSKFEMEEIITAAILSDALANFYTSLISDATAALSALEQAKNLLDIAIRNESLTNAFENNEIANAYQILKAKHSELPSCYSRILYSMGRIYFYMKDEEMLTQNKATQWLNIASQLMEKDNSGQSTKSMETILRKISGTLCMGLEGKDQAEIKKTIESYKKILNDKTNYDNRGMTTIIQYDENRKEDDQGAYSRMMCYDQIAKGYQQLAGSMPHWAHFFTTLSSIQQKECQRQALIYSTGGFIDGETYEGAIPLCKTAKHSVKNKNGTSKIETGFPGRLPIYINTLANSLLLNSSQFDRGEVKNLIEDSKLINFKSNMDIAEHLFKLSVKEYENKKTNFPLVDAYYGLASIYFVKGEITEATDNIEKCIKGQKDMKRSERHPDMKKAIALQNHIYEYLKHEEQSNPFVW